jgi:hypothetical protein
MYVCHPTGNQVDIEAEMCLDFNRFRAICVDFELASIGLSATNAAQVFLASAESKGVGTRIKTSSGKFLFDSADDDHVDSAPAAVTTLHADGTAAWDRTVLFFPQFLDAILRITWFCYASYKGDKQRIQANPWQSYTGIHGHGGARLDHYGDSHVDEASAEVSAF